MFTFPAAVEPLFRSFAPAFFAPTYARFGLLALGAILGMGRRSVSRILWLLGNLAPGHPSSYHRVFSLARWSCWPLAKALCEAIIARLPRDHVIYLAVDDTVLEHRGAKVYGKGTHRDPIRSSWRHTATLHGHRWVVLSILVQFPFASRTWALPVMAALARTAASDRREKCRHKTACQLACGMVLRLVRWFPGRRFLLLGDHGFGHHQLAYRIQRFSAGRCQVLARARVDLRLFAAPPRHARRGCGRPRIRGARLPSPKGAIDRGAKMHRAVLRWYGNQQRELEFISGVGLWYWARGAGVGRVLPVRWVCVRDPQRNRYDCFFSTDHAMSPTRIVENFAMRWALEVTFQECRIHLGLKTPRQRCKRSILRTTPCLLGLFSVVSLAYAKLLEAGAAPVAHGTPCYRKRSITFSDALYQLRKEIWQQVFLLHRAQPQMRRKSRPQIQDVLLEYLSAAA